MEDDLNNSAPTDNSSASDSPSQNALDGQGETTADEASEAPSDSEPSTPAVNETAQVVIRQPEAITSPLSAILQKCKAVIAGHKQKKLEKILEFAKQKNKITNDDVQKLILVSDKTAGRYLSELVKQNKLKRIGSTSQIRYELPS